MCSKYNVTQCLSRFYKIVNTDTADQLLINNLLVTYKQESILKGNKAEQILI